MDVHRTEYVQVAMHAAPHRAMNVKTRSILRVCLCQWLPSASTRVLHWNSKKSACAPMQMPKGCSAHGYLKVLTFKGYLGSDTGAAPYPVPNGCTQTPCGCALQLRRCEEKGLLYVVPKHLGLCTQGHCLESLHPHISKRARASVQQARNASAQQAHNTLWSIAKLPAPLPTYFPTVPAACSHVRGNARSGAALPVATACGACGLSGCGAARRAAVAGCGSRHRCEYSCHRSVCKEAW